MCEPTLCISRTQFQKAYKTYNGHSIDPSFFTTNEFILNDGTIIYMGVWWNVVWISADVNGAKKPNVLGKDLFLFYPTEDGVLLPMGAKGTYYQNLGGTAEARCNNSKTDNYSLFGATCTALRLLK